MWEEVRKNFKEKLLRDRARPHPTKHKDQVRWLSDGPIINRPVSAKEQKIQKQLKNGIEATG